jgi:hypothetical protein
MEVSIEAPIGTVWEEFARVGDIYLSSPTVEKSWRSSDVERGVGAARHMEMSIKKGATLDERVIEWREGTYMKLEAFKIVKVPGIQTMGGDFGLSERNGQTILRSTLSYSMTNPVFGWLNRVMMKSKFEGLWRSILAGYKHHIETGAEVTPGTALDLGAVQLIGTEIGR